MSERAADRPLESVTVARLLESQFPELDGAAIERLGEGWDNEVYVVRAEDEEWIFRFPKRATDLPYIEREIGMMAHIADAVTVAVPRFEKIGEPSEAFPYPFVGYRRIPGDAIDAAPFDEATTAADLGRFFTELHAVEQRLVPRTPERWEDETFEDVRKWLVDDADDIRPAVPAELTEAAEPFLAGEAEPPVLAGRRCVIHNDIGPDHVLVSDGRLSGVIDFADAMVREPVYDFVGLVPAGGYGFVDRIVEGYGHTLDDAFGDTLRWLAKALTLIWLGQARDEDGDVAKHQGWVRRAFEDSR